MEYTRGQYLKHLVKNLDQPKLKISQEA